MRLYIYKRCLAYTFTIGSVSGIFRHIPALLKSMLTYIQHLLYPWHIQNAYSQSIYQDPKAYL